MIDYLKRTPYQQPIKPELHIDTGRYQNLWKDRVRDYCITESKTAGEHEHAPEHQRLRRFDLDTFLFQAFYFIL